MLTASLTQPTGRTYFSFLKRNSDDLYWNTVNTQFEVFNPNTADEATRDPFRVDYAEAPAGTYSWSLDVSAFLDGSYTHQSYEIAAATEYGPIVTTNVRLVAGNISVNDSNTLETELITDAGLTVFSFLRRVSDDLYYKPGDGTFSGLSLPTATEAERALFRQTFAEAPAGTYSWSLDITNFASGIYEIDSRFLVNGQEISASDTYQVTIANGVLVQGVELGTAPINHDTGGADTLKYTTPGGVAIDDAEIRIFNVADLVNPVGITRTNALGRWESPVYLPVGGTYQITFSKTGEYGPDSVQVTI